MVREAVADETETVLLHILLDRIEGLFSADFHLGVGPTRNFDNHVKDSIVLVSEERDVVEGRDGLTLCVLVVDTVVEGVGSANLTNLVLGHGGAGGRGGGRGERLGYS